LLKKFKSAQRVSFAALDELEQVIGVSKARIIYNYYQNKPHA
jgi:excinuclease ABC subunit C